MLKVSKLAVGVVLICATSAHAVERPDRDAARICATENLNGKCRPLGSQAERTIANARAPGAHGSACLSEIKEPSASQYGLSSCLKAGFSTPSQSSPLSIASRHEGKIETLDNYFKFRDSWSYIPKSPLPIELLRLAALPSAATDVPQPFFQLIEEAHDGPEESGNEHLVYDHRNDTSGASSLILAQAEAPAANAPNQAEVSREQIDKALAELLAERESWGTEPSIRSAAAAVSGTAASESEAPVTDLAEYLARRESWGTGAPPKPVNAPLAAGAVSPLPATTSSSAAPASDTPPVVHPAEETPVPQLNEVPRNQIEKALADLLAERESWGTEPASRSAAAASPEGSPALAESEQPVTDLAGYLARRDSWGTGAPPKPVNAPLAAGAVSPLPVSPSRAATPDSDTPPVVHPTEERPVPRLTEVPREQIDKALADLLAERESWTVRSTAASSEPEAQTADAATCAAELREAMTQGGILFGRNSATLDRSSFATLDQVSERVRACQNAFIIVEGHTDDIGSEEMNIRLSEQRAAAVMNYLVEKGVESGRIEAIGFGESRPLVPNTSNENRAKNRRIELRVR